VRVRQSFALTVIVAALAACGPAAPEAPAPRTGAAKLPAPERVPPLEPASEAPVASPPPPAPAEPPEERLDGHTLDALGVPAVADTAPGAAKMRVHLIDVGQGAATLFEFSCGTVLVDTGGETNPEFDSGAALRAYLDDFFAHRTDLKRTLDLVVLSHPHIDHTRNVQAIIETFTVKNLVTNGMTTGSGGPQQKWAQDWARKHARLETIDGVLVHAGGKTSKTIDPIKCQDEDPKIAALWGALSKRPEGWTADAFGNANNHSVVLRIDFGRASFLVSGDLEEDAIDSLIEKHRQTKALDIDVWEVSHHGSNNGANPALIDALTPLIALLATGPPERKVAWTAWQYGHPRKPTVDLLTSTITRTRRTHDVQVATAPATFEPYSLRRAVYATGWDGNVLVAAKSDGTYRVLTAK